MIPVTIPMMVLELMLPPRFSAKFMATMVAMELAATLTTLFPMRMVIRSLLASDFMASSFSIFLFSLGVSALFLRACIFSGPREKRAISAPEKNPEIASSNINMGSSSMILIIGEMRKRSIRAFKVRLEVWEKEFCIKKMFNKFGALNSIFIL